MLNRRLSAACLLVVLSLATTAVADEFHYNNILIGDRASGMGGAYTAVSDDPSGMYYNPAGIAYSTGKNLSASVNAYNVSKRTYKNVIQGADWTRESSFLLPNFFGIVQPVGKLKVGFSYAVPDSNQEDQDQAFAISGGSAVINFNNKNDTNLFGPSVAVQLSDSLSIGATLYAHKRNTEVIFSGTSQATDLSFFNSQTARMETNEWGVRPVIGIMWAPVEKVSVGVVASGTFVLSSETLMQNTGATITLPPVVAVPAGTFSFDNPGLSTSGAKRKYPYQVGVGVAFFPNASLLVSGDLSYFSGYDYVFPKDSLTSRTITREQVINGALGVEYYFNKQWALRSGVFTDFASTPKLQAGGADQPEHIDLFGGSLSLTHFTRNTTISVGGNFKYGTGTAQILGGNSTLNDTTASSWTAFISSSYSY